jgi:hypothetical protein
MVRLEQVVQDVLWELYLAKRIFGTMKVSRPRSPCKAA